MRSSLWPLSLVVASVCLIGCGGEKQANREAVFPVAGKITYKGQPVAGADVTFFCKEKNISSFARTDDQGKFRVTTFVSFDGAPAGKHLITILKPDVAKSATKEVELTDPAYDPFKVIEAANAPPPKNMIPLKYSDIKTTDLFTTITADSKTPEVNLVLKD